MQTDEFVSQINALAGLALSADSEGAVAFIYRDRNVLLRFVEEQDACLVFTEVGRIEPAALPGALVDLLEANHLLSDTQGGALSFQRQTGMAALNFLLPCSGPNAAEDFVIRLNRALSASDEWTARIERINARAIETVESAIRELQENGGESDRTLPLGGIPFDLPV